MFNNQYANRPDKQCAHLDGTAACTSAPRSRTGIFECFYAIANKLNDLNTTLSRWLAEERVNWQNLNQLVKEQAEEIDELRELVLKQDGELGVDYGLITQLGNRLTVVESELAAHQAQQRHTRKKEAPIAHTTEG